MHEPGIKADNAAIESHQVSDSIMAVRSLYLSSREIDDAFANSNRQYLVGALSLPQALRYLPEEGLEVGMSRYTEFTADTPHVHPVSTECLFVIDGAYHILLIDEMREIVLGPGEFLALPPGTSYASKAERVEVLFIKAPGGNDKVAVEVDEPVAEWVRCPPPIRSSDE